MTRTRLAVLAATTLVGAAGAACTTPAAATVIDAARTTFTTPHASWGDTRVRDLLFLTALDRNQIGYLSPGAAVSAAHAICLLRANDAEFGAAQTASEITGWQPTRAGLFVGAATAAYCPTEQHVGGASDE